MDIKLNIKFIKIFKNIRAMGNAFFLAILCLILFQSCIKSNSETDTIIKKKSYLTEKNEVNIVILKREPFQKELVSNGKIIAVQKNSLQFDVGGKLKNLYVKNGDFVNKGKLLAILDPFRFQQKVARAEIELKKAKFQFEDMLVGRGIFTTNKDSISKDVYDMVASRSGYDAALLDLKTALFELKSTRLIAPFSGKVANIENKVFENVSAAKNFITLIDDTIFEIEFYLIESEMDDIALNSSVKILPFAVDKIYKGHISSINPLVEKNGTVLVKAVIKNDGGITEGMNVKVVIEKEIKKQLVVPKSAVVLRDNQEVLFKVVQGRAYWTYVKTTEENSSSYSIIGDPDKNVSLQAGDTVIVSGNLNLAHDSEIAIKSKN